MPKKRSHNFKDIQGTATSNATSSSTRDGVVSSVNERLSELRKVESPDAAQRKRLLAETVNRPSVPPAIGDILGVPESAPPKPKVGVRLRERMRTPGPPPPGSWLKYQSPNSPTLTIRGGGGRGFRRPRQQVVDRKRPRNLLRFAKIVGTNSVVVDEQHPTLLHLALKATAQAWDLLDETDYPALAELPRSLRLTLLSYIGFYGPPIDMPALRALLQGSEPVTYLDLAGVQGYGQVNLRNVAKLLHDEPGRRRDSSPHNVADSWEDEDESPFHRVPEMSLSLSNLTHICLSHPPPKVLWKDLLSVSKHIPHVTHLSLAYWPRPTLTPNLSTATVSSKHSPDIAAGGSNNYSTLDGDVSEPANILRRLSGNLLCLQWLDVEGCSEWVSALVHGESLHQPRAYRPQPDHIPESDGLEWGVNSAAQSVLAAQWKSLTYINISQGWLPSKQGVLMTSNNNSIVARASSYQIFNEDLLEHLEDLEKEHNTSDHLQQKKQLEAHGVVFDADEDTMVRRTHLWKSEQYRLFRIGARIASSRGRAGAQPISIDYGWKSKRLWQYGAHKTEV